MRYLFLSLIVFILGYGSAFSQISFDFQEDEVDFGVIEEGEILTYTFNFINSGKDTIRLTEENRDVRPSCSCTASEYSKEKIGPGGSGKIKAGFNTTGRLGIFNKTILISQRGTPYKTLLIKGVVIKKK